MTQSEKVVEKAKSWIGCKESDGTHKPIIDVYNSHKPRARGYAVKYTDAWCATFVSAVSISLGYTDIIPPECGYGQMIKLLQKIDSWEESDSYIPKPGDIIFYYWEDNGIGDNKGNPNHVGIVEKVMNGVITVIEGNLANAVGRRTIKVNGKFIRGFGVPKYSDESKDMTLSEATTVLRNVVKLEDTTIDFLLCYKYGEELVKKIARAAK